jgi:hypothetical protein
MDSSLGSCDCSALCGLAQLLHFSSSVSPLLSAFVGSALRSKGTKSLSCVVAQFRASNDSGFLRNPFHPGALFLSCHLAYAPTNILVSEDHSRKTWILQRGRATEGNRL